MVPSPSMTGHSGPLLGVAHVNTTNPSRDTMPIHDKNAGHSELRWIVGSSVALVTCLMLLGCRAEDSKSTLFGPVRDSMPEDVVDAEIASLGVSCAYEALERRQLRIVASVMPLGFRDEPTSADSQWSPSTVTDVIASGDALFVLDGMQQVVTKFDTRLEVVASVGRSGEGPGEYVRAAGLGKDPNGNILVADPGTGRVTMLDVRTLTPTSLTVPSLARVESLTMSDGVLYLGAMVVPEFIARGKENGVALAKVAPGSDHAVPLLDLGTNTEGASQLLRLPGPNQFRVVSSSGMVLFIAPAAGTIDIFRQDDFILRIQVCVPEALGAAYDSQLKRYRAGAGPMSQRVQPVVTDAMVVGDTLFAIGPLRDRNDDLHVVKYTLDGQLLGSTAAHLGDVGFPRNVRFWGSPYRLAAFGMQGTLLRVDLEPGSP